MLYSREMMKIPGPFRPLLLLFAFPSLLMLGVGCSCIILPNHDLVI